MKKLIIPALLVVSFLLCVQMAFAGGWFFDNRDVKGTWWLYTVAHAKKPEIDGGGDVLGWVHGTLRMDDKGNILGGKAKNWEGLSRTFTGGKYKIERNGKITATLRLVDESGSIVIRAEGSMNRKRDTITVVHMNSEGQPGMTTLVKKSSRLVKPRKLGFSQEGDTQEDFDEINEFEY